MSQSSVEKDYKIAEGKKAFKEKIEEKLEYLTGRIEETKESSIIFQNVIQKGVELMNPDRVNPNLRFSAFGVIIQNNQKK
jgi:hypothetical protein